MAFKSTPDSYGTVAVSIHWAAAVLILVLIGSGFRAADVVDPAAKAAILRVHVPVAIGMLGLTILRIAWWWRFDRKPDPIAGSPRWQERLAQAVHVFFYVVVFGLVASGVGLMALSGAAPMIFGGEGGLPDFWKYPPRVPHGIGARLLVALLVLHGGAAFYHHFVLRDGLLSRMRFGTRPAARQTERGEKR